MIHARAETAADIARLLRSAQEPITIVAPRQSGKTTELLKFAEEKNPSGQFAMVCRDQITQAGIIRRHWMLFNRIDQSDIVAKRLLGEPLGAVGVTPPLMITPSNLHLLRGQGRIIYVDEWESFTDKVKDEILGYGRFVAGVSS